MTWLPATLGPPGPGYTRRMSNSSQESDQVDESTSGSDTEHVPGRIDDDQLPEDLQPTDDNPLAQPPQDEDEASANPARTTEGN